MALDPKQEVFVVYIVTFFIKPIKVHPNYKVQIVALIADKTFITVPVEYSNFVVIFSKESAVILLEYTKININAINLKEGKQLLYGLIYNLGLVELKTLKIYIKTKLSNSFIYLFKSPANNPILYNKKPNGSFRFFINYQGLKNITIKKSYLLLLIGESFDYLNHKN